MDEWLKVGALARRTGLTVRALHHYDEIGLLVPSRRTSSGHRLYGEADLARLQHIASLRHIGLGLAEIKECLDRPDATLDGALQMQLDKIDEEIGRQAELRTLVVRLRDRLASPGGVTVDELSRTIEITLRNRRYFSPEELGKLEGRAREVGAEGMRAAGEAWEELFAAFRDAMERGVAPDAPEVRSLAGRARDLVAAFTGGDPRIASSLGEMYRSEGPQNVLGPHGFSVDDGLWSYMQRAREALGGN